MDYVMHTKEDAPEAARASLERVERRYGFVPNLASTMAQAPGLLHAYLEVEEAFRTSALSPVEQEVVALTVSYRNGCRYCMAGHSMLGSMVGLDAADVEALRTFTRAVLDARGEVDPERVERFLAAGYTREQVLAVPLGIAFKTLSNLTHHLQPVPVDDPMASFRWEPPQNPADTRVLVTGWLREDGGSALAEYQAAAGPVMKRYGGRPLLKSNPDRAVVGDRPDLVVLMAFPSTDAVAAAFQDPDYTKLIPLRERAFARLEVSDLGG